MIIVGRFFWWCLSGWYEVIAAVVWFASSTNSDLENLSCVSYFTHCEHHSPLQTGFLKVDSGLNFFWYFISGGFMTIDMWLLRAHQHHFKVAVMRNGHETETFLQADHFLFLCDLIYILFCTRVDSLEKGMANHSSILALRTPWTVWKGKKIGHWKMNSPDR